MDSRNVTHKAPSRGEARKAHEWRRAQAHTHLVRSRRTPGTFVTVRCTRGNCRTEPAE
jgi:transposase-like protein